MAKDKEQAKEPELVPMQVIKCQAKIDNRPCNGMAFTKLYSLSPGKAAPISRHFGWVCIRCGASYLIKDFPKKGEEARKESRLIIPENASVKIVH